MMPSRPYSNSACRRNCRAFTTAVLVGILVVESSLASTATSYSTRTGTGTAASQQQSRMYRNDQDYFQVDPVAEDASASDFYDGYYSKNDHGGSGDGASAASASHPPSISAERLALTLRYVGEVNCRLRANVRGASNAWGLRQRQHYSRASTTFLTRRQQQQPANTNSIHSTGHFDIPFDSSTSSGNDDSSELSIFHAKEPCSKSRGAARWGPPLHTFLRALQDDDIIESLSGTDWGVAALYLDRACSVETPRQVEYSYSKQQYMQVEPCPFIEPRTVHRLALTAALIAVEARIKNNNSDSDASGITMETILDRVATRLGMDRTVLDRMVAWMKGALGHQQLLLTSDDLSRAHQMWHTMHNNQRHDVVNDDADHVAGIDNTEAAQPELDNNNAAHTTAPPRPQSQQLFSNGVDTDCSSGLDFQNNSQQQQVHA